MPLANALLLELSPQDRQILEERLLRFESTWTARRLSEFTSELPAEGALRRALLIELVKSDLARQWREGRQITLEAYLEEYPELGNMTTVPLDLVQTEYVVRQSHGALVPIAELAERHGRSVDELRQGLGSEPDTSLTNELDTVATSKKPPSDSSPILLEGELAEKFGRYQILKKLGQGGMGAVYLALDSQLNRHVAIKVPNFKRREHQEVLARFHREARAAAVLTHPNICPVYDVGEIDGVHYLTMAYVDGRALSTYVREPDLAQKQIARWIQRVAMALEEAHRQGIVHRDLKPSNIIINRRGEPILMDFGLAHVMKADVRLTQAGQMVGTPAYMSPEQIVGDLDKIGPPADIYSLGVILYELLTGSLPFRGSVGTILASVLHHEAPKPSMHRSDIDSRLEAICNKAMAKKPENRFESMTEMIAALDTFLKNPDEKALLQATTATIELPAESADQGPKVPDKGLVPTTLSMPTLPDVSTKDKPAPIHLISGLLFLAVLGCTLGYFAWSHSGSTHTPTTPTTPPTTTAGLVDTKIILEGVQESDAPTIHVDGQWHPLHALKRLPLYEGRHTLQVKGSDLQELNTEFHVNAQATPEFKFQVVRLGTLELTYDGPLQSVECWVDSQKTGPKRIADDQWKKAPPAKIKLPPGSYKITFKGGFIAENQKAFDIQSGMETLLEVKIEQGGAVHFDFSKPLAEARVALDGKAIALDALKSPVILIEGEHRLVVSGKGLTEIDETFHVVKGEAVKVKVDVRYVGAARLALSNSEDVTRIMLNDTEWPRASWEEPMTLPIGEHQVRVECPFWPEGKRNFVVKRGETNQLAFDIPRYETVTFTFDGPAEVEMTFQGANQAITTGTALRVPAGEHAFSFSHPWFRDITKEVRIDGALEIPLRFEPVGSIKNDIGMSLVLIPAGKFNMGLESGDDSSQRHEVEITRPYYMSRHEVTVNQFRAFTKDDGYKTDAEKSGGAFELVGEKFKQNPKLGWQTPGWTLESDQPVTCVSWNDAVAFCRWLSKKENATYRLPTEAEWEYACRAGTTTPFHVGNVITRRDANIRERNADVAIMSVGTFKPNKFGLYDMHGNVAEWCADRYDKDYYKASPRQDPQGPKQGTEHVVRGGSWFQRDEYCRSDIRSYEAPTFSSPFLGFRVVRDVQTKPAAK